MGEGWPLSTPRLLIRSVSAADLPALYDLATAPATARMLFVFSPGMDGADFAAHFPIDRHTPPFRAAITQAGRVIGSIGVGPGDVPPVYYFLSPDAAGQGLATEALSAFADWLARSHGLTRLSAEVFHDNPASRKVLKRNGFRVTDDLPLISAGRDAPAPGWRMQRG